MTFVSWSKVNLLQTAGISAEVTCNAVYYIVFHGFGGKKICDYRTLIYTYTHTIHVAMHSH